MEEENTIKEEHQSEETKVHKPRKRFIAIGLIVLMAIGCGIFIHDADVYITDNQPVKEGMLVAKIDDADYKVKYEGAKAKYERVLLNQKNAQAIHNAAQTKIEVAKKDLDRYTNLYAQGAVSKQTLDNAQAAYDAAQANLTQAEQSLLSKTNDKVADTDLKSAKADMDKAALDLSYTKIYAPQSGTVSNRRVEKGMYVNVGTPLFVVVPHNVWVVANFKENQLRHMKPGQAVDIKIDTYPDKVFKGKVDSIQRASGAKSSLFPPENAVGSFVKIVQRIPVKIVFDEKIDPSEYNIIPGMSVVPKVRIR